MHLTPDEREASAEFKEEFLDVLQQSAFRGWRSGRAGSAARPEPPSSGRPPTFPHCCARRRDSSWTLPDCRGWRFGGDAPITTATNGCGWRRLDLGRRRGMAEFLDHGGRKGDLSVQPRQHLDGLDDDEASKRPGVRDHQCHRHSPERRSSSMSSNVNGRCALWRARNSSACQRSRPSSWPT